MLAHIRALGPLRVTPPTGASASITQPRRLALLAYLALAEPRGLHSRDSVLALLWAESGAEAGRHALRNSLHALRKVLGRDAVVSSGQDLVGIDAAHVACDVHRLYAELDAGHVVAALDRYAEPLSGFHVAGAPEFEHWLDATRATLRARVLGAARAAARQAIATGDAATALMLVRRARAIDPEDELLLRQELELSAAGGDLAGAHRSYRAFASRLAREYDVAPAAETEALMATLATRRASPADDEAYVLYVRGTYLFLRAAHVGGRVEDLHLCRELFERALTIDPGFGAAYAGLSNYHAVCAARGLLQPFAERFGHAIALARRALELNATLAIPHVHLGVQAMYLDADWVTAGREFRRASALDPRYAEARRFLGIHRSAMGAWDDGIAELREAVRAEPHMPHCRNSLADALLATGAYDEAIAELRTALRLDATFKAARDRLVRCLERTGRLEEAVQERRAAGRAGSGERFALALAREGAAGYRAERAAELRATIVTLAARATAASPSAGDLFNPPALQLALAHAELGEWAEAWAWEERGCATQPGRRQWFIGRPELAPLSAWRRREGASSTE